MAQNISGRRTSTARTHDRYTIPGVLCSATKHGRNMMTTLREAFLGQAWMPELPASPARLLAMAWKLRAAVSPRVAGGP